MADKLIIDIWKKKTPEEITKAVAEPYSRLEIGSAAAITAASAAALCERVAAICAENDSEDLRLAYLVKNSEIIRSYMIHLIDEDIKSRGPLKQALKEGDPRKIDATRQPATCIAAEIINMMVQTMDFLNELAGKCPKDKLHYLGEAAHLAMGAVESCRIYIVDMADKSSDDTYRFVTRRENQITIENLREVFGKVIEKAEAGI